MEMEFSVALMRMKKWHEYWIDFSMEWFKKFGIREENLMIRKHGKEELLIIRKLVLILNIYSRGVGVNWRQFLTELTTT